MDYGKAIKIIRTIAGLQQKDLAELTGVDASLISLFEKGKRLASLSDALENHKGSGRSAASTVYAAGLRSPGRRGKSAGEVQSASEWLARI